MQKNKLVEEAKLCHFTIVIIIMLVINNNILNSIEISTQFFFKKEKK